MTYTVAGAGNNHCNGRCLNWWSVNRILGSGMIKQMKNTNGLRAVSFHLDTRYDEEAML